MNKSELLRMAQYAVLEWESCDDVEVKRQIITMLIDDERSAHWCEDYSAKLEDKHEET